MLPPFRCSAGHFLQPLSAAAGLWVLLLFCLFLTKKHALLVRNVIAFGSYSICTVTKCHPISFAVFVWNLARNTKYLVPLAAIDAHYITLLPPCLTDDVISITPILKCVLYLHWWWRLLAVDWRWYAYPSMVWFTWLDFVECFSYPRKEFAVTIFSYFLWSSTTSLEYSLEYTTF